MDTIAKLTIKDMGCNPKAAAALPNVGDRIPLARVWGVATGTKTKEDKRTSEFHTSLVGNFRGLVTQPDVPNNGKTFGSGICYLPGGIHELIESPLMAAEAANEAAEVKFAFDIFSYRASNAAGLSYVAVVIGEPAQNDPLADMEAQLSKIELPKLEAPKKEEAKSDEKKKDKADA